MLNTIYKAKPFLKDPSAFYLLAFGSTRRMKGGINLEKYLPAFHSWVLFSCLKPKWYCLLMHCQNLNQKGIKLITIKNSFLKFEAIQEPSHASSSKFLTLQPKKTMMAAMSFKDYPIEVMTSAKKKSLNLTVPKGEMKICKSV